MICINWTYCDDHIAVCTYSELCYTPETVASVISIKIWEDMSTVDLHALTYTLVYIKQKYSAEERSRNTRLQLQILIHLFPLSKVES